MSTYIIICGGTGGHLTPGIAVAERLIQKGHACTLVVSQKKIDKRLSEKYTHLDFVCAPGVAFSLNPKKIFIFLKQLLSSLCFYRNLFKKTEPDFVLSFGGFLTVGGIIVAYAMGIACILHEANRVPGKAIRFLSFFARRLYLPPGLDMRFIDSNIIKNYGYPVRLEIQPIPKYMARLKLRLPLEGKILLVLGGSQGAQSLNNWVRSHYIDLANNKIHIVCITGLSENPEIIYHSTPEGRAMIIMFKQFVDDIHLLLSACDLVVSRSGAGSIAEFIRCQLPSILVPYPHAAGDHQEYNARFLERQAGCIVVESKSLHTLLDEVKSLMFNEFLLFKFGQNLKRLNLEDHLELIVKDMEALKPNNA